MEFDGKNFDLQSQLFQEEPCDGCYFRHIPCCMELVGTDCSKNGHAIWVLVGEDN